MIYYIADTHFGHANVIKFDGRPFKTLEEMDATLVENWNKVVTDDDTVYVIGDMFWHGVQKATPIMKSLHGKKILLQGNHDKCNCKEFMKLFAGCAQYMEIDDNGRQVVLCHYPMPTFKNHYWGWYHLYGHVHNTQEWLLIERAKKESKEIFHKSCDMFNVGCMMPWMDYTPRTLDEIIQYHKEHDAN